jgi:hypothetical protein
VLRATALDGCGRPKNAACSSIVTEGFISVAFTANTDTGTEISVTNAAGKVCIRDTPCPTFTGYTVEITFCEVNPDLYAMLSGQGSVFDSTGTGVGFRVNSDISACDSGVALELWSSVPSVTCDPDDASAAGSYGYILVPFLQGGVLGDFTLENDAVSFTITGAATKTGSGWGVGPYDVVSDGSTASPLLNPITNGDHLHVQYTTVAPPTASCDCVSLGTKATSATSGKPGTWAPADSYAPANLADATGVTATPNTAWTSGEYVVLGDNSRAHWNGTAWAAGEAGTLVRSASAQDKDTKAKK